MQHYTTPNQQDVALGGIVSPQREPEVPERLVQVFLSQNLHLLGLGKLQLVELEHQLPDVGKVDILAKRGRQALSNRSQKRNCHQRRRGTTAVLCRQANGYSPGSTNPWGVGRVEPRRKCALRTSCHPNDWILVVCDPLQLPQSANRPSGAPGDETSTWFRTWGQGLPLLPKHHAWDTQRRRPDFLPQVRQLPHQLIQPVTSGRLREKLRQRKHCGSKKSTPHTASPPPAIPPSRSPR